MGLFPLPLRDVIKIIEEGEDAVVRSKYLESSDLNQHTLAKSKNMDILRESDDLRTALKTFFDTLYRQNGLVGKRDHIGPQARALFPERITEINNQIYALKPEIKKAWEKYEMLRRLYCFDNEYLKVDITGYCRPAGS